MTTDLAEDLDRVAALTKGTDLQWPYVSEVALKASATLKELEAKLASADAMIEAQAKDHASNNIRFAEATHRAEVAEAERDKAYARGYSDAETEISKSALGQRNAFLHSQYANAADHIKVLTEQRDRLQAQVRFLERKVVT